MLHFAYVAIFLNQRLEQAGGDSFVGEGFTNWKKKERFQIYVGGPNSAHNRALNHCRDLMNQNQHITTIFFKQLDQDRSEYRTRLNASVNCVRFLLRQGLAFRGHDESESSSNQGNFRELLQFLANNNEDVKTVAMKNVFENLKLTALEIQKDIVNAAAIETVNAIINNIGDALFSIMIDESRDVLTKEQMAVALRYVDKKGHVIGHFVGIEHVTNTTALSLKAELEELFLRHGLSMSKLCGQGYDGASNMQGEFNGLKTLTMRENGCAVYVHCFAHQLQLALVAVSKNHSQIASFFNLVANVVNVVGVSCKRCDILREKQATMVIQALKNAELPSGQGLNQEISFKRSSDTRWGSHYGTLINLIAMFSPVIDVLEIIEEDGLNAEQRGEACTLLDSMQSFDFVLNIYLMTTVLRITNELSQALQMKDQDIVNTLNLVDLSKQRLQMMRDSGWDSLFDQVSSFCDKHTIVVPNMDDMFLARGQPRRNAEKITNLHHYQVELFYTVIDMQLQELNNRFTEVNTKLLLCVTCLNPNDSFFAFDKQKLIRLAQFYSKEFSTIDLISLDN